MSSFEDSYLGQLRKAVGKRTLLIPSIRGVVRDKEDRVVLVRRRDNGTWVFPGGFMELGESVLETIEREVREETGLHVVSATLVAIHSEPRFAFTNVYGGHHQTFNLIMRVDEWTGSLAQETEETTGSGFFPLDDLPDLPDYEREILSDDARFLGQVIMK